MSIKYPEPGDYEIYGANKEVIPANEYNEDTQTPNKIKGEFCGENRYLSEPYNQLQFWMEPGCDISVDPRDAIFASVRMDMKLDKFFEKGGIGTFKGRMAKSLGIKPHNMKVVRAYRGSVIVDFFLFDDNDDADALDKLRQDYIEIVPKLGSYLGGPIITFSYGDSLENTVVMPGYEAFIENEARAEEKAADEWILEQLGVDDGDLPVVVKKIFVVSGGGDEAPDSAFNTGIIVVIAVVVVGFVMCALYKCVLPKCRRSPNVAKGIEGTGIRKATDVIAKSEKDDIERYDVEAQEANKQYTPRLES